MFSYDVLPRAGSRVQMKRQAREQRGPQQRGSGGGNSASLRVGSMTKGGKSELKRKYLMQLEGGDADGLQGADTALFCISTCII